MLTIVKKERIVFISVLVVTSVLLLIERLTSIEINNNIVLFFLVFTVLGNLSLIISQYLFGELSKKYVVLLLSIVFLICLAMAILTWTNNWKTQAILYRNTKHPRQTIEYRMRSKYGFGFEKQIVRKKRIFPYIDDIVIADTTLIDKSKWIRVNEIVNEMGFPGEYTIAK
jgi:hypothetical protein